MIMEVQMALNKTLKRIAAAALRRNEELQYFQPRLIAVSKTKPVDDIICAYECGQRHFGENYVQELVDKASDTKITNHCPDIRWHFIGHLQSNKISKVISVPNLYMIETVDSIKLADAINRSWKKMNKNSKLKVYLQVNSSKEENKSGCSLEDTNNLAGHIIKNCDVLELCGLMTIGSYDHSYEKSGDNPDYLALISCKNEMCEELGLDSHKVELSMGMSSDFEHAIELGSNSVRVGSLIFGARTYAQKESTQ